MQPINMIYYRNKKLKKDNVLKADIITIKNDVDLMSFAERMHFLQDMFQMTSLSVYILIINIKRVTDNTLPFCLSYRGQSERVAGYILPWCFCSEVVNEFFKTVPQVAVV